MIFRAEQVLRRTKKFEGFRSHPYQCTLGVWTIGYGATMWRGEKVTMDTPPVTEEEASIKVRADIFQAVMDCQSIYSNFEHMGAVEQEILIHMCFQLGMTKLKKFVKMNDAVRRQDIGTWEMELKNSLWFRQTPRPAVAMLNALIEGEWTGVWVMDDRQNWT